MGRSAVLDPAQARAKNREPFKFASERRPAVASQPRTRGENRPKGTNQSPRTDFVAAPRGAPVEGPSALPASSFLSSAPQQRCALRSRALARPAPVSETLLLGWEAPMAHLHHLSRWSWVAADIRRARNSQSRLAASTKKE